MLLLRKKRQVNPCVNLIDTENLNLNKPYHETYEIVRDRIIGVTRKQNSTDEVQHIRKRKQEQERFPYITKKS